MAVTSFIVRSFSLDYLDLFWEVGPGVDPEDYKFKVLRSQAPFGPYEAISGQFSDRYHFRDTTVPQVSFDRIWYYRLEVTSRRGVVTYPGLDEPGVHQAAPLDLEGLEVARIQALVLQEYTGRRVWLFPLRTFGQRCMTCWDSVSGKRTRSRCLLCYDTSYTKGFLAPVAVSMGIDLEAKQSRDGVASAQQVGTSRGELSNYPVVKAGDLVVEVENVRWEVSEPVEVTRKLRAVVKQSFPLVRVPRDSVLYKLPVRVGALDELTASPERQFTNPRT